MVLFLVLGLNEDIKSTRVLNPIESTSRRAGNFVKSLIGVILGLLLFFLVAPYLLYQAEFQYTAQHFSTAVMADPINAADGYVYLFGKATLVSANPCIMLTEKQCLYYDYTKEQLVVKQKVVCGSEAEKSNVQKISAAADQCKKVVVTENGQDVEKEICKKCWHANVSEWDQVDAKKSTPEFRIGVNLVIPNSKTSYKGDLRQKSLEYNVNNSKYREKMIYLEQTSADVLAVGSAKNGVMASGDPFVVSTKNFEATKKLIIQEQASTEWMFRIGGFLAYLFGMLLILGPIPMFIEIGGGIPWLGGIFRSLGAITKAIMFGVSVVIALVMTVLLTLFFKVLRFLSDNILFIILGGIILGVLVILGIALLFKNMKKPDQQSPSQ